MAAQGISCQAADLRCKRCGQQQHFPDGHPILGISRHALAQAQAAGGRVDEASATLDQVLERDLRSLPPRNVLLAYAHGDRGWLRLARGDLDGARWDFDAASASYDVVSAQALRVCRGLIGRAVLAGTVSRVAQPEADAAYAARGAFGAQHAMTLSVHQWRRLLENPGAPPPAALPFVETTRMQRSRSLLTPPR